MREAVPDAMRASIEEAFGDAPIDDVVALGGGRSGAKVFAFVAEGRAFVARQSDSFRRAKAEPSRELACMRIAADSGIAPAIRHVDLARGIVVLDRIDGVMFGRAPSRDDAIDALGRTLRRLHDGPTFPACPPLATTFQRLNQALHAQGGEGVPPILLATVDALAPIAAHGARVVSCHNDLNPSNIIERGDRVFFIDWEGAGAGDAFFDLGTVGVFACNTPEARARVLRAYLGRAPNDQERARSVIGRALALAYYAGAFCYVSHLHRQRVALSAARPMREVLAAMTTTPPNVVAASLARAMEQECASSACADARSVLTSA